MSLIKSLINKKVPWRYERKYSLSLPKADQLIAKILASNFYKAYPDRRVNSLYFDTHDLKLFRDSVDGSFNRYKIRRRWYGKDKKNSQLEIKVKKGELGQKQVFNFNKLPKDIKSILNLHQPVLTTAYQRQYYQHRELPVRLTLDSDLQVIKENITKKFDQIILELKYDSSKDNEELVEKLGQILPLQLNQFSKYTLGLSES
jgi:SPX domain protein involved in polyphosphate accumulation